MAETSKAEKKKNVRRISRAVKDLVVLAVVTFFLLILSYFFNIFSFLIDIFRNYPRAITFIDEIVVGLVSVGAGLAVFAWRRLREFKKEAAARLKIQKEFVRIAETKADTERIISRQLRGEIEHRKQLEEEVVESERSLTEAQKIAHLGSWEYLVEKQEMRMSEETFRIFGLDPALEAPTYEEYLHLIHADDVTLVEESIKNALQKFEGFTIEKRIIRPDGTLRYVQNIAKPILTKDGKVTKIIGTTLDITEAKQRSIELNKTRQFLETIVNGITEQIILISKDFKVLWANKTLLEQFNCNLEDILGRSCHAVTHNQTTPCQPPHDICPIAEVYKKGVPVTEVHVHQGPNGEFFSEVTAYPIKDEKGEIVEFVHIARDITEQKKTEEKLRALSLTDPLTDLYNRRGFLTLARQQLKLAKRNKQDVVLLFVDVDNMKSINDGFGHQQGDLAVQDVAALLKKSFRESDIIARVGGDEFAVLAIQANRQSVGVLTEGVQAKLNELNSRTGRRYPVSLSMGIAECDYEHICAIEEMLSQADKVMYEQKRVKEKALSKNKKK